MDAKKVGNFVKELREENNMSQGALAKKVYVASSVVSRWEAGKANISANNLILLSDLFHVSLDELVAGHRFEKEIEEEKKEVLVEVLNSNQRSNKLSRNLMHIIAVILILFLGYLVYNFYNSIQLYSVHIDTDKYNIQYGMLTKTRDRIYFHLDVDYNGSEENIESVAIYRGDEDSRQLIIQSSNINSLDFIDYYGYEEYIKFNEFNKVINDLYLEVNYRDGSKENYKLTLNRTYANIDFFLRKSKRVENGDNVNNETKVTSEISSKIERVREILDEHNDYLSLTYDGVDYEVYKTSDGIKMYFIKNNVKSFYIFDKDEFDSFAFQEKVNDEYQTLYVVNLIENRCLVGDCSKYENHYFEFRNILDVIIEK